MHWKCLGNENWMKIQLNTVKNFVNTNLFGQYDILQIDFLQEEKFNVRKRRCILINR